MDKKLTLVSFIVFGVRFSKFMWLDAEKPVVNVDEVIPFGIGSRRGTTVMIGG